MELEPQRPIRRRRAAVKKINQASVSTFLENLVKGKVFIFVIETLTELSSSMEICCQ